MVLLIVIVVYFHFGQNVVRLYSIFHCVASARSDGKICSVCESADNQSLCCRHVPTHFSRYGRVVGCYDACNGSTSFSLQPSPSCDSVPAFVTEADSIAKFQLFINAKEFIMMEQEEDRVIFVDARLKKMQDTVLRGKNIESCLFLMSSRCWDHSKRMSIFRRYGVPRSYRTLCASWNFLSL